MTQTSVYFDSATADETASALQKIWWLMLIDGIVSLLIGFLVLSWRHQTLFVLAYFFGAWLCFIGVLQLVSGFAALRVRWPHALMGLVSLGAGIATLVWPHVTLYVIATILGWTLLLWGLIDIFGSFLSREVPHWWIGIIKGVVLIALGVWAIRHPGNALTVLVVVFGISCVFWGIVEVIAAFFARHARASLLHARSSAP
ncbi:MAG TPA: DUF308 domain-containing protein [Acidimicrobiales bacterium]